MISIVINPVSGGATPSVARRRAELAAAQLTALGEPGEVVLTTRRGHGRELAEAAVRRGDRLVIAWGGDGTVNEIASALVHSPTMLGVVAAGSGNGLARELSLPTDAAKAIALACRATPRVMDAGELGGRWFFSIAGIGFDAHVAAAFDTHGGRRGFVNYARIVARELLRYECADYRVDGRDVHAALLVTIANSAQFGNGARIAPQARIDDGELDLVVFEERNRLATLLGLRRLFDGTVARMPGASLQRITRVIVESTHPMGFHVDGEPCRGGTRLEACVHPGVVRVAGPART